MENFYNILVGFEFSGYRFIIYVLIVYVLLLDIKIVRERKIYNVRDIFVVCFERKYMYVLILVLKWFIFVF